MAGLHLLLLVQDASPSSPGTLVQLVPWGILTLVAGVFGMLHRSAMRAYRYVADTSRETATLDRQRADALQAQLMHVLAPLKDTAAGSAR